MSDRIPICAIYHYDHYRNGNISHVRTAESNASQQQDGNYPLHLAASREDSPEKMEIVNFLLQQDINDVSKVGKYENPPLLRACGGLAINKLLIIYDGTRYDSGICKKQLDQASCSLLSNRYGKRNEVLESTEYIGTI